MDPLNTAVVEKGLTRHLGLRMLHFVRNVLAVALCDVKLNPVEGIGLKFRHIELSNSLISKIS